MSVVELVRTLYEMNVRLWTEGGRLRYAAPAGVLTKEVLSQLLDNKTAVIALLQEATASKVTSVQPAPRGEELPLSYAQQGLWFLDRIIAEKAAYNISFTIRIRGELEPLILEQGLNEIVTRHEILRTLFPEVNGRPAQYVLSTASLKLAHEDHRYQHYNDSEAELIRCCCLEARVPFNLQQDLPLRAKLYHVAENDQLLLLVMHHIVADGLSLEIVLRELVTLYDQLLRNEVPKLTPLPIQYSDFSWWQRKSLTDAVLQSQLVYWQNRLVNLPPLRLPTDRAKPVERTFRGAMETLLLSKSLTQQLRQFSREERTPVFVTLMSAFVILLSRYGGQEDVAIGVPVSNRDQVELEGLIGLFVNTVIVRVNVVGSLSFREFLATVHQRMREAYAHRHTPFEKVVGSLQVWRDLRQNPLFQVMFASQNPPAGPLAMTGCSLTPEIGSNNTAKFDLCTYVRTDGDIFRFRCEYSSDLFNASTITQLLSRFENLLQSASANREERVSRLPLVLKSKRKHLRLDRSTS